jgi:uncharacterized protein YecT (DUF1311 family)
MFLLAGVLVAAAQVARGDDCESATTTRDMATCLQEKLAENEKQLDQLEEKVQSVLEPDERILYEQAQLAWESFRLANCNSARSLFGGGTMAPIAFLQCKVGMTERRLQDVQRTYETRLQ